jgi:hypothetical protein
MPFDDDCRGEPVESSRDTLDDFAAFAAEARKRLDAGRVAYGDASFSKAPAELVAELQQEALDLAGWGFVLWSRLERMRLASPRYRSDVSSPAPADDWWSSAAASDGRLLERGLLEGKR